MKKLLFLSLVVSGLVGAFLLSSYNAPSNLATNGNEAASDFITEAPREIRPAFEQLTKIMAHQETGQIDIKDVIKERKQVNKLAQKKRANFKSEEPIQWDELGPNNVGGRTRALVVDKMDNNIIYSGSVTGGMFRSTDAGSNWENMIDAVNKGCQAVTSMTQTDDGTLFIGTGSSFEVTGGVGPTGFFPGSGIFRSTDQGQTYEQLTATIPANNNDLWTATNRMASQTINGTTYIYAGTRSGLQVSSDNGNTWSAAQGVISQSTTYDVRVATNGKVYAMIGAILYRSNDGITFEEISGGDNAFPSGQGGRKVLAVAPSDPNYVYVVTLNGDALRRVYQSNDGGDTFNIIGEKTPIFDPCCTQGGGCQGTYDLCLMVTAENPERIFFGGISLWTWSVDGGWSQVDKYFGSETDPQYIHPDKQGLFSHPTNPDIVYCTNDGGIYVTNNANDDFPNWQALNRGYNTYQCYGIAANHKGWVASGAQDNGTHLIDYTFNSSKTALDIAGGDGIFTELSNIDSNIGVGGSQNGNITRTTSGGSSFGCVLTRVSDATGDYTSSRPAGDECEVNGGSFFIHPFFLWEDIDLFYEINNWEPEEPFTEENSTVEIIQASNGQTVIITTDASLYDTPIENVYNEDVIYVGFDIQSQSLLLGPNDDKIRRSRLVLGSAAGNSRLWMTEDLLKPGQTPNWVDLTHREILGTSSNVRPSGGGTAAGFSEDGDMVILGTDAGGLLRVTGLNSKEYEAEVITGLPFSGRHITEVAVNPTDPSNVMVTTGNYGNQDHVYMSFNFESSSPTFTSIQGDLPQGPVYTGVILTGSNTFCGTVFGDVLVGTTNGVYFGEKQNDDSFEWFEHNQGLGRVPVFRMKQEKMATKNEHLYPQSKVVYIGVHGRGMFRTTSLTQQNVPEEIYAIPRFAVGVEDVAQQQELGAVKVYPNPATTNAQVIVNMQESTDAVLNVYDLTGKMVLQSINQYMNAGENQLTLDVSPLATGNYIVSIETAKGKITQQLIVGR